MKYILLSLISAFALNIHALPVQQFTTQGFKATEVKHRLKHRRPSCPSCQKQQYCPTCPYQY